MTFSNSMTRQPIPFDAEIGAQAAAEFGRADVSDLIAGAAGCAPYLARLVRAEAEWLRGALDETPDAVLAGVLKETAGLGAISDPGPGLRQQKRRAALYCALADLAGVWDLHSVTGALTRFADCALEAAMRAALAQEVRRGRLPGQREDDLATGCGMVALAMGKMGAYELNYSSDIDLICLFDETRFDPADYGEARAAFVRATKAAMKSLSQQTGEGYVFRTDLRLRPDPSVTPVCLSMEAAERYYESLGRNWERAAHIKARPAAGDLAAGAAYLERLRPFVFRKHLDFAAIQDAHDIRLKIRAHRGLGGAIQLGGHNLKLGRGGIREIEFFTQTRQLIAGGRDEDLRVRGTCAGLAALAHADWVPGEAVQTLSENYTALREAEHRVQMVQDAQTHIMPADPEEQRRIACLSGVGDVATYCAGLLGRLEETEGLIDPLYAGVAPGPEAPLPFSQSVLEVTERWQTYPALRSERGQALFDQLRPVILSALGRAGHPDEALVAFDTFLAGLPSGVQLFSLFAAQPHLIDLIVDICAVAPDLARYLARNSGVLDAVLDGDFFEPLGQGEDLAKDLGAVLAGSDDYETALDQTRRWHKEMHFRIGVQLLRGMIERGDAAQAYARLAEAVLVALWPRIIGDVERRHGPIEGRGATVLGMGSLGAGRLTARSDLDLIVVYDAPGDAISTGRRSLGARAWFAKLTQALVTALSAMTAEGRLYEVDMRLRPSGRKGPVATSLAAFDQYQRNEAWLWEHLALTRARAIVGAPDLVGDVMAVRGAVLALGAGREGQIAEALGDMRARFDAAGRTGAGFSLKHGPGRMQDIELAAQAHAYSAGALAGDTLVQLEVDGPLFSAPERAVLAETYVVLADLLQAIRLVAEQVPDPQDWPEGLTRHVLAETGCATPAALVAHVSALAQRAAQVIDQRLAECVSIPT